MKKTTIIALGLFLSLIANAKENAKFDNAHAFRKIASSNGSEYWVGMAVSKVLGASTMYSHGDIKYRRANVDLEMYLAFSASDIHADSKVKATLSLNLYDPLEQAMYFQLLDGKASGIEIVIKNCDGTDSCLKKIKDRLAVTMPTKNYIPSLTDQELDDTTVYVSGVYYSKPN